jgi:hypothetical protein
MICAVSLPDLLSQVGFKLDPSMFSTPEKQQLPLERCMRILPHHQVRLCSSWKTGEHIPLNYLSLSLLTAEIIEACTHKVHARTATPPGVLL